MLLTGRSVLLAALLFSVAEAVKSSREREIRSLISNSNQLVKCGESQGTSIGLSTDVVQIA